MKKYTGMSSIERAYDFAKRSATTEMGLSGDDVATLSQLATAHALIAVADELKGIRSTLDSIYGMQLKGDSSVEAE